MANTSTTLDGVLAAAIRDAVERKRAPYSDARLAAEATRRAFVEFDGAVTLIDARRIESYFAAVLRRRAARRGADRAFSSMYLLASIVADLRSGGRSNEEILSELEEDWAPRVPGAVMDEFRMELAPPISA